MREIVQYPDPILKKIARPVTDEELRAGNINGMILNTLIEEMTELMSGRNRGIGLAAPQVGESIRLILVQPSQNSTAMALFNPEIVESSGKEEAWEGCLSLPGIGVLVKRPTSIKVKAKSLSGEDIEFPANGLFARVIQHEVDHLDGILIITRGNITNNRKIGKQLAELEKTYRMWAPKKKAMEERAAKAAAEEKKQRESASA